MGASCCRVLCDGPASRMKLSLAQIALILYIATMIVSFRNRATEGLFNGIDSKAAQAIPKVVWPAAIRKLDLLNAAHDLRDLRVPPGNRLESLKGKLIGYHSIRINDQFRLVFQWADGNARNVFVADYHN